MPPPLSPIALTFGTSRCRSSARTSDAACLKVNAPDGLVDGPVAAEVRRDDAKPGRRLVEKMSPVGSAAHRAVQPQQRLPFSRNFPRLVNPVNLDLHQTPSCVMSGFCRTVIVRLKADTTYDSAPTRRSGSQIAASPMKTPAAAPVLPSIGINIAAAPTWTISATALQRTTSDSPPSA